MIEKLANEYLALKDTIAELDAQAQAIRAEIQTAMNADSPTNLNPYVYATVEVISVKGRTTTKLDRTKLVQLGVAKAVLDAATVTRTGARSIRITRPQAIPGMICPGTEPCSLAPGPA